MSRLVHSEAAFLRKLQISRAKLFVFVEGGLDRPFSDSLVSATFPRKTWQHQVISMKELPGATGGKPALVEFFRKLRRAKKLDHSAFGKKMICCFLADKDVDDITRRLVRSPYFLYTKTYDLEGHLISHGNIIDAVSSACLTTRAHASSILGDPKLWIGKQVENWKYWLGLCMLSQRGQVNVGCGFSRPSNINDQFTGPTDAAALDVHLTNIAVALRLSKPEAEKQLRKQIRLVELSIRTGDPLKYFKGKWMLLLIERAVEQAKIPDSAFSGAADRVASTLVARVGTATPCPSCASFTTALGAIAAALT